MTVASERESLLEARRRRAAALIAQGLSQAEVARRCNVSRQSVSRWARQIQLRGVDGLHGAARLGRKPRLTNDEQELLVRLLRKGPRAAGITHESWSLAMVIRLLEKCFGKTYRPASVGRLLRRAGLKARRSIEWTP